MQEPGMQESVFPPELSHLYGGLSRLISQGMSSAYGLALEAQLCQFRDEPSLMAFLGVQARAHFAMRWQHRIEALAKENGGCSLRHYLEPVLQAAALTATSIHEVHIIELIHDALHDIAPTANTPGTAQHG